jgi:hypothetical protein
LIWVYLVGSHEVSPLLSYVPEYLVHAERVLIRWIICRAVHMRNASFDNAGCVKSRLRVYACFIDHSKNFPFQSFHFSWHFTPPYFFGILM